MLDVLVARGVHRYECADFKVEFFSPGVEAAANGLVRTAANAATAAAKAHLFDAPPLPDAAFVEPTPEQRRAAEQAEHDRIMYFSSGGEPPPRHPITNMVEQEGEATYAE